MVGKNLQELEVVATCLVNFAYPITPEYIMECLAMQTFMDDVIVDEETQCTVWSARALMSALATVRSMTNNKKRKIGDRLQEVIGILTKLLPKRMHAVIVGSAIVI